MESTDKLYLVTCIFNPESYKSRYRLYDEFKTYISQFKNVELHTVELVFGDQPFAVTSPDDPCNLQLRTDEVLWFKENLLNIGIKNLPPEAKYICWIDADIKFSNTFWAKDTMEALDKYDVVQMFDKAHDLGPDGSFMTSDLSFINRWQNNNFTEKKRGRSGFAWAATRPALEKLGYLIDWGIVGSADWFMAFALTDQVTDENLQTKSGGHSHDALFTWVNRCREHIKKNVGYVSGSVYHSYHGKKADRGYNTRWKILVENAFNPDEDLEYDSQGLIRIKTDKPKLREDIKDYFHSRNEDA